MPLHQTVALVCGCCGLLSDMVLHAESDQRVCGTCKHHGAELDRVRAAHIGAVKDRERVLRKRLQESELERVGLRETIASEYQVAPPESALAIIGTSVVLDAREEARTAFRLRDDAMVSLWRVLQVHREGPKPGKCVCGQRSDECRVLVGLDGIEVEVRRWERSQEERVQAGKDHSLPRDHPLIVERHRRGLRS